MKSRASLVLMEQLVMVLVFALAASLCLGCFAKADQLAERTARRDEAVRITQNAAELLKAGKQPENPLESSGYTLKICPRDTDVPGLRQAEIQVFYESDILFTLTAGWQEDSR